MGTEDLLKRRAAAAAMQFLPESGIVGLGSGTTARHAIALIGERVRAGAALRGVATSRASAVAAREEGIPLLDEDGPWEVDVTFDGADEVTPDLDLIKGAGGALTREKIVSDASRCNVILVDAGKRVSILGEKRLLPVEVTPFGCRQTQRMVEQVAGPSERRMAGRKALISDNGNYILDVRTGPIPDPAALERDLETLPGVVACGLFVGRTDILVVASESGVEIVHHRNSASRRRTVS